MEVYNYIECLEEIKTEHRSVYSKIEEIKRSRVAVEKFNEDDRVEEGKVDYKFSNDEEELCDNVEPSSEKED